MTRVTSRVALVGLVLCSLSASCGDSGKDDGPNGSAGGGEGGTGGSGGTGGTVDDIAKEDIGNQVFDEEEVQSYYLTLSESEYAKLNDLSDLLVTPYQTNSDRYVEASLRFGDTELPSIGVRFKGNYSIWGCVDFVTKQRVSRVVPYFGDIDVCQRFSLKLDFDRYDENGRLDGLKKLNLHAMAADPSRMRERLGYSLFRDMDIPAPRVAHARLYINGEYQGVVAAVENLDGRFTAHQFPESGDGNLYKQIWPAEGTSTAEAQDALRSNEDPEVMDVSDFMAFKDAVAASTESNFASQMAPLVDLDYLARYIVVDRGIANFDSIMSFYFGTGWGPNNQNYYWYHHEDGRFMLIPWDMDKVLWYPEPNFWSDNVPNGQNVMPNWNVITNGCDGHELYFDCVIIQNGVTQQCPYWVREIDCDPFLRLLRGEIYDRQKAIADQFIAGPFSEASVKAKLDAWSAQIADAMAEDPLVDSDHWQTWVGNLLDDLPNFQANLSLMMDGLIEEP